MDGTVHVIDNDPDSADYLKVIAEIDLCDSNKETCDANINTPNGSGPHGMYYSPVSGLIYVNNEDYGTETIIDPVTNTIVDTDPTDGDIDSLEIGFAGATHISPDGEFILVRGTDRSNPDHVVGKLSIIDTADNSVTPMDLQDINIGDMKFTPDGHKLYVAVALTGSTAQKAKQKDNVVVVYDASALPDLPLIKEITVGKTAAGRSLSIHEHDGEAEHIFVTNRADGTVSVVDAEMDEVMDTVCLGEMVNGVCEEGGEPTSILAFSLEGELSHN
jgi:YVTN family beta-propeller protein